MNYIEFEYESELPQPVLSVSETEKSNITMYTGPNEILRVAEDGFYVRGKKVPVDENEGKAVFKAFKEFLVYHGLSRSY